MSLEAALQENTATMRELIAALTAAGALQTAQASAAAASSPAVKAVVKAQKEADAKKPEAAKAAPAEAAPNASGEQSASTGESSSQEENPDGTLIDKGPVAVMPWSEKTAAKFAELKDAAPDLDNVRKAVLGINSLIGREQATAVLGRFGVQAVTPKDNKKGLDESQYAEFFTLCLEVLSGKVDATASMVSE